MIELVTTIIITASSVLLFGYWFRYTCLLILSAKTTRDFASEIATGQSTWVSWKSKLSCVPTPANLDTLRDALDRDYAVLNGLMKNGRRCFV